MRPLAIVIAFTLLLAACGGGDDDADPTASASPTGPSSSTATATATPTPDTSGVPSATPCAFFPLDIYRLEVPTGFTTTVAKGIQGTWSPNSGLFAYVVPPGSQSCGEGLNVDAAVSHQRQFVVPGSVGVWAWAPDSASIAVSSYPEGPDELTVVSVPAGETTLLIEEPVVALAWSPESTSLAFARADDTNLRTLDIDGDQADYGPLLPQGGIASIAWSPALDRIAVVAFEGGRNADRGAHHLFSVSWPDGTITEIASHDGPLTEPRFSSDGSHILYETFSGNDPSVYVAAADASSPPTLLAADGFQAQWSPDGNLIAYVAGWCQSFDIAVIAPDGSGQAIVSPATEAGVQLDPTWSPDGILIAFHSDATYTVHPDGTNLTRVADRMENLAFSPDGRFLTGQAIGGRGLCEG
jgi:Tol biopolymer transport system component